MGRIEAHNLVGENATAQIARHARDEPDHPALWWRGREVSYAALEAAVDLAVAAAQRAGLHAGDRVALALSTSPDWVVYFLATLRLGAVAVAANPLATTPEREQLLGDAAPALIVEPDPSRAGQFTLRSTCSSTSHAPHVREQRISHLTRDHPATLLYTSGTTSYPRGVLLSHGNLIFCARAKQRHLRIGKSDRLLLCLPVHHCYGQIAVLYSGLAAGATVVLGQPFSPQSVADDLAASNATMLFGVPAMYRLLASSESPLRSRERLRFAMSAGASLDKGLQIAWQNKFDLPLSQAYGLTESSPFAAYHSGTDPDGSIGQPIDGVDIDILAPYGETDRGHNVGELAIRGPNVMLGYWKDRTGTSEAIRDGWLRTGDVGYRDNQGNLWLVGRKKRIIIVSGQNVSAPEVERVLLSHKAVASVRVYGAPSRSTGERVHAQVVALSAVGVTGDELRAHCRRKLSLYKVPVSIEFVDVIRETHTSWKHSLKEPQ
jgi:long-chain acyl-CoA synthetase